MNRPDNPEEQRIWALHKIDEVIKEIKEGWSPQYACGRVGLSWTKHKKYLLTYPELMKANEEYKQRMNWKKIRPR